MLEIYKKELKYFFTSMMGYVFIALFLLAAGYVSSRMNLYVGYANFEYVLSSYMTLLFIVLAPILTMRIMAEERRSKTDQLLLTSPLSVEKIIFGKYFAVATVFLVVVAVLMIYPLILSSYGEVSFRTAYVGILGFALLGLTLLALGTFISTCLENQVIAAVVSFFSVLLLYFISDIASMFPSSNRSAILILSVLLLLVCLLVYWMLRNIIVASAIFVIGEAALILVYKLHQSFFDGIVVKIFSWLSVMDRYQTFMNNSLDLSSVIYLLSFTYLFLFLSIQSIKKRRWR